MSLEIIERIANDTSKEPLAVLKRAVVTYDQQLAKNAVEDVIDKGIDPIEALGNMSQIMKYIGDAFENDELYLPDLVGSGETMLSVLPVLNNEITKRGNKKKTLGTVLLGTVKGDVHSIGKTMVSTLLTANGFEVIDLGVDISADKFIAAIKENKPEILAMSALLTTTALEQKNVMERLAEQGMRDKIKVMVGGGAITDEFANRIGADGYEATAPGAVGLAVRLINEA